MSVLCQRNDVFKNFYEQNHGVFAQILTLKFQQSLSHNGEYYWIGGMLGSWQVSMKGCADGAILMCVDGETYYMKQSEVLMLLETFLRTMSVTDEFFDILDRNAVQN